MPLLFVQISDLATHGAVGSLFRTDIHVDRVTTHGGCRHCTLSLSLFQPCKTAWRVSFLARCVCQSSAGPAPAADRSEDYVSWRGLELSVLRVNSEV